MKKNDFNFDIEKYTILFFNNLSEKDKRLFAGLQAMHIGYYGVNEISNKFKVHKHTVRRGQKELLSGNLIPYERIRNAGGGRKKNPLSEENPKV
jgi:predicted transcriptional regulator